MEAEDNIQMLTLYSLGQLDPASRATLEGRLSADAELRGLACDFKDMAAQLMVACSPRAEAPTDLKAKILDRVAAIPARLCTDVEGRVTSLNSAFCALCGHTFQDLRGKKPGQVLQGPKTDPAAVRNLREAIQTGRECSQEIVNYHKDGSTYRVRINLHPLRSDGGELLGFEAEALEV